MTTYYIHNTSMYRYTITRSTSSDKQNIYLHYAATFFWCCMEVVTGSGDPSVFVNLQIPWVRVCEDRKNYLRASSWPTKGHLHETFSHKVIIEAWRGMHEGIILLADCLRPTWGRGIIWAWVDDGVIRVTDIQRVGSWVGSRYRHCGANITKQWTNIVIVRCFCECKRAQVDEHSRDFGRKSMA